MGGHSKEKDPSDFSAKNRDITNLLDTTK